MSTHQTPEPPSDAALRLQQASQRISGQRTHLAQGEEGFGHIIALLDREIMTSAPNCEHDSSEAGWKWWLGEAVLRVGRIEPTQFQIPSFEDTHVPLSGSYYQYRSSFNVIAKSSIAIIGGKSNEKSYHLWYCDAQEPDVFEWYGLYSRDTKMVPVKSKDCIDSLIKQFAGAVNRS